MSDNTVRNVYLQFSHAFNAPLRRRYRGVVLYAVSLMQGVPIGSLAALRGSAIYAHIKWADDGWADAVTKLDVSPPKYCDYWVCNLRQIAEHVWIATPVEFAGYSHDAILWWRLAHG